MKRGIELEGTGASGAEPALRPGSPSYFFGALLAAASCLAMIWSLIFS